MRNEVLVILYMIGSCLATDNKENIGYSFKLESLRLSGTWDFSCGASLIGVDRALSAAHCVDGTVRGILQLSSFLQDGSNFVGSASTSINISQIIIHPDYVDASRGSDIAILLLEDKFIIPPEIGFVTLSSTMPPLGSLITISRYGLLDENGALVSNLQFFSGIILSTSQCNASYEGLITDTMFCAGVNTGGNDTCQGFSDLATFEGKLVGISSFGNGCGVTNLQFIKDNDPEVYTNIPYLFAWIQSQLESLG